MKICPFTDRFFHESDGGSSAEYALVLSVMVIGLGYASFQLGANIEHAIGNAANGIYETSNPADGASGGGSAGGSGGDASGDGGSGGASGGSGSGGSTGDSGSGGGAGNPDGAGSGGPGSGDSGSGGSEGGSAGGGGGPGSGEQIPGGDGGISPDPEPDLDPYGDDDGDVEDGPG